MNRNTQRLARAVAFAVAMASLATYAQQQNRGRDDDDEQFDRQDLRDAYRRGYERGYDRGYRKGMAEGDRRPPPPIPAPPPPPPTPVLGPIKVTSAFYGTGSRNCDATRFVARQSNGKLYIVHATPPMQLGTIYTGPIGVPTQVVDDIHARARKASLEAMSALRHLLCDDVNAAFDARPGHPITFVIAEAKQVRADLIVLAASGRSRVSRFFVGSTADRVIREAPCPVLVVPASPEDLED